MSSLRSTSEARNITATQEVALGQSRFLSVRNTWVHENRVNGRVIVRDPHDGSPVPLELSQLFLVAEKPAGREPAGDPWE